MVLSFFVSDFNEEICLFNFLLVMSCGYTLIESGGVRSQNAGHSLFKTLLILSKSNFINEIFFSKIKI
jgi:hypothetical protein